jgi:sugar phosphate isomerase/epimerase
VSIVRSSVIDRDRGGENLAYAHRAIDAAARLGCTVVGTGLHQLLTAEQKQRLWFWTADGHRDDDSAEARRLAVSRFAELGRHAADVGLLLSLELYEDTFLGTSSGAVRMIEDIGLANVGLNPDVGNLVRLHRPVEDWRVILEATLPYANYWHVKNYLRDEDPERGQYVAMPTPLESGFINYREAMKVAVENGFQGIICLENYGGDGLSICASNQDYLRRRVLPRRDYSLGVSRVRQSAREHAVR